MPIFTFPDLRDLCERKLQLASRALALQPWVCEPDRGRRSPLSPRCNFQLVAIGDQRRQPGGVRGVVCPEQGAGWPRALKRDTVSLMLIKDVMGLPLALTMIHPTHCRQMRRAPRVASRDARATEVHRSSQKHTHVMWQVCGGLAGRGARLAHLLATQVLAQSVRDVAHGLVGAGRVLRPGGRGQALSRRQHERSRACTHTHTGVCVWLGRGL